MATAIKQTNQEIHVKNPLRDEQAFNHLERVVSSAINSADIQKEARNLRKLRQASISEQLRTQKDKAIAHSFLVGSIFI